MRSLRSPLDGPFGNGPFAGRSMARLTGLSFSPSLGGAEATISTRLSGSVVGEVYIVVVLATATAPSAAQIAAGTDGSNAAAVWDITQSAAAVNSYTGPVTGLTAETNYIGYAVWFDGVDAYGDVVSYAFTTLEAPALPGLEEWQRALEDDTGRFLEDGTPRFLEYDTDDVLTGLTITPLTGGTTAAAGVNCTVTTGIIYLVIVPYGSAVPTAAQIEAGTDGDDIAATDYNYIELSPLDTYLQEINGLEQDTQYTMYVVVRMSTDVGDYSNVVTGDFTTLDSAPALSSYAAYAYGSTTAVGTVVTDDPTGTVYAVLSTSATVPTAMQIAAGQMHTGSAAAASDSVASTSAGRKAFWFSGLSAGTAYYMHVLHRDVNLNDTVVTSAAMTTDATETSVLAAITAGTISPFSNLTAGAVVTENVADPFGGTSAITITDPPSGTICQFSSSHTFNTGTNKFRVLLKKGAWAGSFAYLRVRILSTLPAYANYVNLNTKAWATTGFDNEVIREIDDDWILAYAEFSPATDNTGNITLNFTNNVSGSSITDGCAANHNLTLYNMKITY